jgi:anti-sigma factor RsiW
VEPERPEMIDEFERELKQAMVRRPAPPNLKRRVLEQREKQRTARAHQRALWWQRVAASILLAGVIAGGYKWRQAEEQRKGEEAKQQVLTALRITNRALNDMNRRLTARNHSDQ